MSRSEEPHDNYDRERSVYSCSDLAVVNQSRHGVALTVFTVLVLTVQIA